MEPSRDRRVRIARPGAPAEPHPVRGPASPPPEEVPGGTGPPPIINRAGTQRARRLALTYLLGLAAIFGLFWGLSRGSSVGGTAGATSDLALFGELAVAIGAIGAFLSLISAPATIERAPEGLVVHGLLGYRRTFGEEVGLSIRVLRRYPAGWFSAEPVESVEIASRGVRRTYLVEAGLLPEQRPTSARD